jgi:uncharacterized membrane protein YbhN (UPF0104 family)
MTAPWNKRQRRLRAIVLLCAAVVVVDIIVASLVHDFSDLADVWWVLAVPIGLLLVGAIGVVAAALLIWDRRKSRAVGAT